MEKFRLLILLFITMFSLGLAASPGLKSVEEASKTLTNIAQTIHSKPYASEMLLEQIRPYVSSLSKNDQLKYYNEKLRLNIILNRSVEIPALGDIALSLIDREQLTTSAASKFFNVFGYAVEVTEDYTRANELYRRGLEIASAIGESSWQALSWANIGSNYHKQGLTKKALQSLINAYQLLPESDEQAQLIVNRKIATLYFSIGQFDKAIEFYSQALSLSKKRKAIDRTIVNLQSLANVYIELKQPKNAIKTLTQLLAYTKATKFSRYQIDSYIKLSKLQSLLKIPVRALNYINQATALIDSSTEPHFINAAYLQKAQVHFSLKQYQLCEISLAKVNSTSTADIIQKLNLTAQLQQQSGKLVQAIESYKKLYQLENDRNKREHLATIERIRIDFDSQQTDIKNTQLSLENQLKNARLTEATLKSRQKNRQILLSVGVILLLLAVIVILLFQHKRLKQLANTDRLSGLFNRQYLFSQSETLISKAENDNALSIVMLDIDHFKRINDQYGHLVGDLAIEHIARSGQRSLPESSIFCRIGGEEFVIILPQTSLRDAMQVAEDFRRVIAEIKLDELPQLKLTASFGVANYDYQSTTIDSILSNADRAMYQAKERGRNQVCRHYADVIFHNRVAQYNNKHSL